MLRFFFYGTLMDPLILSAVLRRPVDARRLRPAMLAGFRRVLHRSATYPVLIADTTAEVDGILASGLTGRDARRLVAYEGSDYRLASLPVRVAAGGTVSAGVFLPVLGEVASTLLWDFGTWRRQYRKQFLRQIRRSRDAPAADRSVL
ncbi:MAG: gamma-glutamylcyclotransferase family protein [Rhodospirillales bacterium]